MPTRLQILAGLVLLVLSGVLVAACGGSSRAPEPVPAPEVLLGSLHLASGGGTRLVSSELEVGIRNDTGTYLVVASALTTADVGQVVVADPQAPDFSALAAHFTDGVDRGVTFAVGLVGGGGSGHGIGEPTFFATGDIAGLVPDAAGFTITKIEVEVHALTFDSPGRDPNNDGLWTEYTYELTWRVYGRAI